MIKVYLISKPKYVEKLSQAALDLKPLGIDVVSRWVHVLTPPKTDEEWKILWEHCIQDVCKADMGIILPNPKTEFRGGLVEIGAALACEIPVIQVNSCKSFKADAISDSAFTLSPGYHKVNAPDFDMETATVKEIVDIIHALASAIDWEETKDWS